MRTQTARRTADGSVFERWIASKECAHASQPIEPTTAEGYRKFAQNICHYVGDMHVHELTAGHLHNVIGDHDAWFDDALERLGRSVLSL